VQSAVLGLASGRERLVIAEERLGLALRELFEARDRFVNGVAGNIEIITAQASLVRARDAEIEARFAVASARVALAGAAGVAQSLH
jgi:outer membrane protein TolC